MDQDKAICQRCGERGMFRDYDDDLLCLYCGEQAYATPVRPQPIEDRLWSRRRGRPEVRLA